MLIPFYKYQATANDFIIVNQMVVPFLQNPLRVEIARWCDRRLGVGADGLMIIAPSDVADFTMIYYNADGGLSTMCGNGGRAIAHLAHDLGLCDTTCTFEAVDGLHEAVIKENQVRLKMIDIIGYERDEAAYVINTGSPHYVTFEHEPDEVDVAKAGRDIRYSPSYAESGINVNFAALRNDHIEMRTYERGVEGETYSCGTGVTAAAFASLIERGKDIGTYKSKVVTRGGTLGVTINFDGRNGRNVWLEGPAEKVFEGSWQM